MELNKKRENPPIYTVLSEIVGWTLDRTADFPEQKAGGTAAIAGAG